MALKPSAVPGMIISFSPFIWADRLQGHKVLNHARMPRVSVSPVVPAAMQLRGPDISTDMRLLAASEEAAGSEESEPVAMGLGCPLGCWLTVRNSRTSVFSIAPEAVTLNRLFESQPVLL